MPGGPEDTPEAQAAAFAALGPVPGALLAGRNFPTDFVVCRLTSHRPLQTEGRCKLGQPYQGQKNRPAPLAV